jgi:hypothetical protein
VKRVGVVPFRAGDITHMGAMTPGESTATCSAEGGGGKITFPCTQPFESPVANAAPDACERASAPLPLVAHCAAGLARTFTHPLVYSSYTANLLHAFGGRHATFLLLKTFDVQPKDSKFRL